MGFLDNNMFSSKSSNENKTITENVSGGASDGSTQISATGNVEVLDAKAIQSSFDFAKENQVFFGESLASVLGIVEKSVDAQGDIVGQYADARANEITGGMTALVVPIVAIVAVGFVGYKVLN